MLAKTMGMWRVWGANTRTYLRFRLLEWLIWCLALMILYLVLPNKASEGGVGDQSNTTLLDAITFAAFTSVYVYVIFLYAALTALAFLLISTVYLRNPIGLKGWLLLNVGVPGAYGATVLAAFYGKSLDLTMWLSWAIVVGGNAWLTVRESQAQQVRR